MQERAVAGEQGDACFEGVESRGAGVQGRGEGSVSMGVSGCGDGRGGDVAVGGDAEADGFGPAGGGQVGLGELVVGGGEADLEAFGFAGPALVLCLGEVTAIETTLAAAAQKLQAMRDLTTRPAMVHLGVPDACPSAGRCSQDS